MQRPHPWKCVNCLVYWTGTSGTCWICGDKGERRKEIIIPSEEPRPLLGDDDD